MKIAEVIGTVTLSRAHPALTGASWRLVVPLGVNRSDGNLSERTEPIAAYDDLGAGFGTRVAIADGAEAAAPFKPNLKPIDAYSAAILDDITIAPSPMDQ